MGVVGSVSIITVSKLEEFKSKPDGNTTYGNDELYMDKSFWDINYVLTKYFVEEYTAQNQDLIYGSQKITDMNKGDEVHYAYSDTDDIKKLQETISQYHIDHFSRCFDQALNDQTSILHSYNGDDAYRKHIIDMFTQLQSMYKKGADNDWAMIYIYG